MDVKDWASYFDYDAEELEQSEPKNKSEESREEKDKEDESVKSTSNDASIDNTTVNTTVNATLFPDDVYEIEEVEENDTESSDNTENNENDHTTFDPFSWDDSTNSTQDLITNINNPSHANFDTNKIKIKKVKAKTPDKPDKQDELDTPNLLEPTSDSSEQIFDSDTLSSDIPPAASVFADDIFSNASSSITSAFSYNDLITDHSVNNLFLDTNPQQLSNTVFARLISDVKHRLLYHLINFYFYALRRHRFNAFLKVLVPQLRFANKKEPPGSTWTETTSLFLVSLQQQCFQPLNLFNLNTNCATYDEFIKQNNTDDLDQFFNSILFLTKSLNVIFTLDHNTSLDFSLNDIKAVFASYYDEFSNLCYFNNTYKDELRLTYIDDYFDQCLLLAEPKTWFNDVDGTLNRLIWSNFAGGYEDACKDYHGQLLYLITGIYSYLKHHETSLSMDLSAYIFDDFKQIEKEYSFLRNMETNTLACPILILAYPNNEDVIATLNENNNFVQFVDLSDITQQSYLITRQTPYVDVIKKGVDIALSMKEHDKIYLTYLPHVLNNDEGLLNTDNLTINNTPLDTKNQTIFLQDSFTLQITSYNSLIRTSTYALLINDNQNDIQVAQNKQIAANNNLKIMALDQNLKQANNQVSKEVENKFFNQKANLNNQSLLLKPENQLIDQNILNEELLKLLDTFAKKQNV